MKIWIDLANSPHVIFFLPLIKKFLADDHKLFITIRDFAQTLPLARKYGINGKVVGKHGGANLLFKLTNMISRTAQLLKAVNKESIDIAISHNSYTHTIAARLIGAKVITIMDYEGQPANHLAFRMAHKVLVPKYFPDVALKRFGATDRKTFKYDGFKEQLYLSSFNPDPHFIDKLVEVCNLSKHKDISNKLLITVRTPPTMALYHHFQNAVFNQLLESLNQKKEIVGIILPRTKEQDNYIKSNFKNLHVPSKPLDGMNLSYYSDLVISAGGTMNREAAIIGTPAYSIFLGSTPAVDLELIKQGRIFHIKCEEDLKKISYKKTTHKQLLKNPELINVIYNEFFN